MARERFVIVGLARAQTRWFEQVAGWCTAGALPAEFLMVLSIGELRARLQSGRAFSALLVDATLPGCDRDLADMACSAGCALVVVDDRFGEDHWSQLGAAGVLRTRVTSPARTAWTTSTLSWVGRSATVTVTSPLPVSPVLPSLTVSTCTASATSTVWSL